MEPPIRFSGQRHSVSTIESTTTNSEKDLIQRACNGDKNAYGSLVSLYSRKVITRMYYLTGSRETAEDLAQEVFLRAFRGIRRFQRNARFSTWLYRITHNVSASFFAYQNAQKRNAKVVSLEHANEGNAVSPARYNNPARKVLSAELREAVETAIQSLPDQMRELVVLRDMEGRSYEEIQAVVSLPAGTIKSRIHRGRLLLREKLKGYL